MNRVRVEGRRKVSISTSRGRASMERQGNATPPLPFPSPCPPLPPPSPTSPPHHEWHDHIVHHEGSDNMAEEGVDFPHNASCSPHARGELCLGQLLHILRQGGTQEGQVVARVEAMPPGTEGIDKDQPAACTDPLATDKGKPLTGHDVPSLGGACDVVRALKAKDVDVADPVPGIRSAHCLLLAHCGHAGAVAAGEG